MINLSGDVKLYVITHAPYPFYEGEALVPIATTKAVGDGIGIISSDTQDNISDLNYLLAEFTTFYWAWKNDFTSKYISFFHYRRYLILDETNQNLNNKDGYGWTKEYVKSLFDEYDIILPTPITFGVTVYDQYCRYHNKNIMDKALAIIEEKYKIYYEFMKSAIYGNTGYYCNMFVMRREDFNDYMVFMMSLFEDLKPELLALGYAKNFAYLAERIFSGYVEYLKNVKNFRIKEVGILGH